MAFPTTPILDTLQTGSGVAIGATHEAWVSPSMGDAGTVQVDSSGAYALLSGTPATAYLNTGDVGPDSEVYITVPTLPSSGSNIQIWARVTNPLGSTSGYFLRINPGTIVWELRKKISGAASTLIGSISQAFNAGDSAGLSVIGSQLTAYYSASGGSWAATTLSNADASITGAGVTGFTAADATISATGRITNFGGSGNPFSRLARPHTAFVYLRRNR